MATKTAYADTRQRRTVIGYLMFVLAVTALVAAGCSGLADGPQVPADEELESFSARRESEDGAIVSWSGYVEGYEPGDEAEFSVSITNETAQDWDGRFCLQLMDDEQPEVIGTLEQRPFTLESGVGFSDTLTVQFPENVDDGAHGISLVVRRPDGPLVNLVPITVGETDDERRLTTQEDMDAALDACPAATEAAGEPENLVTLAKEDLAERAGVDFEEIVLEDVKEAEFPDASLGVPEPGKTYAQVITPGYVIRLRVEGEIYEYHAAGERAVLAVEGA